jgi:hypothetical protein
MVLPGGRRWWWFRRRTGWRFESRISPSSSLTPPVKTTSAAEAPRTTARPQQNRGPKMLAQSVGFEMRRCTMRQHAIFPIRLTS